MKEAKALDHVDGLTWLRRRWTAKGLERVAVRAHLDFFQQTEFKTCF
jgi:hypothetical protein